MPTRSTTSSFLALACWTIGARAEVVLYDTTWITDSLSYTAAYGNALGGQAVWGQLYDVRLADDVAVQGDEFPAGFIVENIVQDSVCFHGRAPADGVYVRFYRDLNGTLVEPAFVERLVPVTRLSVTSFDDPVFGMDGVRIAVDLEGSGVSLPVGTVWTNIQPADTSADGDWYYQVVDTSQLLGYAPLSADCRGGEYCDGWRPIEPPGIASLKLAGLEGVDCGAVRRLRVKCQGGILKAVVRTSLPSGTQVAIDKTALDGERERRIVTVDESGRGRWRTRAESGLQTVSLPQCLEHSQQVDCGS